MKIVPIHPGEVLAKDFMMPLALTANALALAIRVSTNRITDIVRGKRGICAETALRLARYFGTTPELWVNLQARYDVERAQDNIGARVEREGVAARALARSQRSR
jgi:antitoxin HigA-1